MAGVVRESGLKRFGAVPNAAGTLSRLVCARARAAGIDVVPLMVKAGVTRQQVEDDSVRLTVQGQIRFVELVANALQDDFLGFHELRLRLGRTCRRVKAKGAADAGQNHCPFQRGCHLLKALTREAWVIILRLCQVPS